MGVRSWILCPIYNTDHLRVKGGDGDGGGGGGRRGEENMSNRRLQLYHIVTNILVKKIERKEKQSKTRLVTTRCRYICIHCC